MEAIAIASSALCDGVPANVRGVMGLLRGSSPLILGVVLPPRVVDTLVALEEASERVKSFGSLAFSMARCMLRKASPVESPSRPGGI